MPKPFREQDESRSRRRKARGTQQKADWLSVPSDLLQATIGAISNNGGAIRFGYTRDGGAYAIGILGDGEPYTEYLRPSDDIVQYFEELLKDWGDESPSPKAP
jgi:hypothetical protein